MNRTLSLACAAALLFACAPKESGVGLELLAKTPPTRVRVNEVLELRPAEGHYFNLKAPQVCADFQFTTRSPRVLRCQITSPGTHHVHLSVCDDEASYCRFAKFPVIATAPKGWTAAAPAAPATARRAPKGERHPIPGFIENQPEKALDAARAEGKLLLIDFYGIWCPPCNMLDEYVYKEAAFQEASADMVRAALDADAPLSWEWKARFKVGGYPTVVLADANLDEIGRFVGYRPLGAYLEWLKTQKALAAEPISKALDLEQTPARRRRIGMWRYDRKEFDEAIELLADASDEEARMTFWLSKRGRAQKLEDREGAGEALKELIAGFPKSVEFPGWVLEAFKIDEAFAKARVDAALSEASRWLKSPRLDETGYEKGDLLDLQAQLWMQKGDEARAKRVYARAAEEYGVLAEKSSLAVARAANMNRAYFLRKSGDVSGAKKLYETLASAYAEEFTFNFSYASVLHRLEEEEKALEYARKAEENAYGDNWLRAVYLKASIELALGRKDDARKTVEAGLFEAVIPNNTDVRTHAYIKRLRELLEKVS